ncbi:MAG: hypothetical protein TRG1_1281 [Flavobacteriaceae bacterium FS1-H7996/R]|nr:MAG: hypothetical protein TRG1_1281 [Flavobacteriaceae bacterium FS1-H7996/R]
MFFFPFISLKKTYRSYSYAKFFSLIKEKNNGDLTDILHLTQH